MTVPVLVLGSAGQVGTAFREVIPDAVFLERTQADLADESSLMAALDAAHPGIIVNCAAYTAVDAAESHEEEATAVNARAPGALAAWCARHDARLLTFSTDYVFDGTKTSPWLESDRPCPLNAYGRSKELGERLVLEAHDRSLIIRTSWVVSSTHPNFVSKVLQRAAAGPVEVVADQHGCPTIAADLARVAWDLLDQGATGIVHVTNEGATTWFGLAQEAFKLAGVDPTLLSACRTEDFPTVARRPAYSVLGSERRDITWTVRHWTEALGEMLVQRRW